MCDNYYFYSVTEKARAYTKSDGYLYRFIEGDITWKLLANGLNPIVYTEIFQASIYGSRLK